MPTVAKYYMAEKVKALLDNWARWPGWQSGGSSRSTLAWLADFVSNRRVGDYAPSIPVMGGEAADTHRALGRMERELAAVLIAHYTGRGSIGAKIAELNKSKPRALHLSRRTYYRRLDAAHPVFMEAFRAGRQETAMVDRANTATPAFAGAAVARRHRLVVSPKMGLVTEEKTNAIKVKS